jgi:hypothetical protein
MRHIATYRPAISIVERPMMKPSMTPHHHPAMWKKRSPVLSACHALTAQRIVARIHGGLRHLHEDRNMTRNTKTYAASSKLTVVENPRVWVNLCVQVTGSNGRGRLCNAHVGKKFTKLRPRSCVTVWRVKSRTRGSLIAILSPSIGLLNGHKLC